MRKCGWFRAALAAFVALAMATAPALCVAQSDPASTGETQPPGKPAPLRSFIDWLLKPVPPRPGGPHAPPPIGSAAPQGNDTAPDSAPAALPATSPGTQQPAVPSEATQPTAPFTAAPAEAISSPSGMAASTGADPAPGGDRLTSVSAAAQVGAVPLPAPAPPAVRRGMALILPAKAENFARAAEVTRKGFMVARDLGADKPEVLMLETDGTAAGALAAYQEAVDQHVAVIVGPLTKTEVAAVMKEPIRVPTLMLNTPDGPTDAPRGLYLLSLSTELEARAAAEAAYRPEARSAVIVTTTSALSKRASAAFLEAWSRLGGVVREVIEYSGNLARVKHGVDKVRPDVVFLAADAERARLIKPFLGRNVQVIATSQVYSGTLKPDGSSIARADLPKIPDLNGLRFIDMPWLHQPDHAAAMVFPRPDPPLSADLERLYALGIDAYRVAEQLTHERGQFEIDGVTGRLLVKGGLIERTPIEAEYRDGLPVPFNPAVLAHDGALAPTGAR